MKRIVLPAALMLLAFSAGAQAQVAAAPALPNTFPTLVKCEKALESGLLRFYEPKYFGLRNNNPVNFRDRIVVPLESDRCMEMLVVGGRLFVAQREGTLFRAHQRADGSISLYARNDCGNPVSGVVYPPPPAAEPAPPPVRERIVLSAPPLPPESPVMRSVRESTAPAQKKKGGFCSSKGCRWTVAIVAVSAGSYAAYQLWPCPPGTVRR